MKIAYFDCFSGISGDMTIGALLDAGLSFSKLSRELKRLGLKGYEIRKRRVLKHGISGTKFDVIVKQGTAQHAHRPLRSILRLIDKSSLNTRVKSIAKDIFTVIGKAEARVHGASKADGAVLHELGDIDSIVDIVGTAIAIDELGIDEVRASAINDGRGFVDTRHGTLPVPSPAAIELLKGAPVSIIDVRAELVTPTGAGIIKTLSKGFGAMPRMVLERTGYGAGTRDLEGMPNMLRVLIGERQEPFSKDRIVVIEANIDDMNPQCFEYLFERLFKEGALDVFVTNIQMKKTRPAFKLSVLAEPPLLDKLSGIIFRETTTIGVRFHEEGRFKLERKMLNVKTRYGNIRVKVSTGPGGITTPSPEYEDCVKLARAKKVPFKVIYDEAKAKA